MTASVVPSRRASRRSWLTGDPAGPGGLEDVDDVAGGILKQEEAKPVYWATIKTAFTTEDASKKGDGTGPSLVW